MNRNYIITTCILLSKGVAIISSTKLQMSFTRPCKSTHTFHHNLIFSISSTRACVCVSIWYRSGDLWSIVRGVCIGYQLIAVTSFLNCTPTTWLNILGIKSTRDIAVKYRVRLTSENLLYWINYIVLTLHRSFSVNRKTTHGYILSNICIPKTAQTNEAK
jgi:hypothetical protein